MDEIMRAERRVKAAVRNGGTEGEEGADADEILEGNGDVR